MGKDVAAQPAPRPVKSARPAVAGGQHLQAAPATCLLTTTLASLLAHFFPQDVAVSSGSACTSASLEPSYVLRALGVEEDMVGGAARSARFGRPLCTLCLCSRAFARLGQDALTEVHRLRQTARSQATL